MYTNLLLAGTIGDKLDSAFYSFDMGIFQFFGNMQSDFLTVIAKFFTSLGSVKYMVMMFILALVLCLFKKTRKVGLAVAIALIIGTIITNIIVKPAVLRIRPYNTLQSDLQYWSWYVGAGSLCESDYSFPSGHTTAAFEIATALFLVLRKSRQKFIVWIVPFVAILTGASRIYLMVHYPTDVLAAAIVGIIAGVLGYLLGSALAGAVAKRKIDDIVDLERLFKKGIRWRIFSYVLLLVWLVIAAVSFVAVLHEGGENVVRCAYSREYDCQNEAKVDSSKYPPINGECYCKIHWKQLNEEFKETGTLEEIQTNAAP